MKSPSQRFAPSKWSKYGVPALLTLLLLALLITLGVILLSMFGLTPGA